MGSVLALDIATKTGWALWDPQYPQRPYLGSIRLPADVQEIGRAGSAMVQFLTDRHQMHGGLSHIVFEAQHVAGGKIDIHVIARLLGLAGIVEWFAHEIRATCYSVHISTWRKHALGSGNLTRERAKLLAMQEARRLGMDPGNDDEAEAFCILDYYLALREKKGDASVSRPWRDAAFLNPKAGAR